MKRPVTTCSIGFEEKEFNEAGYAREVAKLFHSEHHEETVRPSALEIMDTMVWHYDESSEVNSIFFDSEGQYRND